MVYDQYVHADREGWEKNEPIVFGIDTLKETSLYSLTVGMRISDEYPFQNLQIVIDQTVFPSKKTISDVVNCKITGRNGMMLGHGISLYQYDIPVRKRFYMHGDSISVKIRHNMKREILPGIVDVGITMKKGDGK